MQTYSRRFVLAATAAAAVGVGLTGRAAEADVFSNWPAEASPATVGKRVADNFAARPFQQPRGGIHYAEVCTWYGSLMVAQLTNDSDLRTRLIKKFDPLLEANSPNLPPRDHVDDKVFGVTPLEIYLQTREQKYLDLGKRFADEQWAKTTPDGITAEARYWIDDMYMITALQVQAYRATNDAKYLDRAALTMVAYLDKLQQPNGLFFHGTDAQFFWGRGNGWVAAGMTELLRSLPADHPRRARVMEGYKKMMESLLKYQGEDGVWKQLIDNPESWPETSSTGMFAFAMVTGSKSGWLDAKTYGPVARKAWLGLMPYIDENANIGNVCEGTGKGTTVQYYLNRRRNRGDLHGQAPIVWTASALLRS
jgi:unsaturated rhamnogalacturonyl hydrolase